MKASGFNIALPLAMIGALTLAPAPTKAEVPMKISQAEEMFMLTVPDKDTTKSAYGGKLRRYDVHIAKMFEVTFQLCRDSNGSADSSFLWNYKAGGGSINMGTFRVLCEDTDGVALMIGMGRKQPVRIYRSSDGGVKDSVVMNVPTLTLSSNAQINHWMKVTRSFKPIR